jgi:hypothetical protein
MSELVEAREKERGSDLGKVEAADEIHGGDEGLVLDVETCEAMRDERNKRRGK